ncbi:MAG: hypothetical protein N2235_02440 [Fischerella sp.]|nr:hypothetical protein [Fischerella sp.]
MSISSLNKFTVPLVGGQSATAQGLLMPKLKFRFRVNFLNFGVSKDTQELTKQVVDIKRPTANFNPFTLDVYNSKIHLVGKPEWQPTSITLRDDVQGSVSRLVGEQIQKQFDFMEQASAATGIDYKFGLMYEVLDGGNGVLEPTVLETWELYGCLLESVDYGDMNYGSNEDARIVLNIRFDNALQKPDSSGVGTLVGRAFGGLAATGSGGTR